MTNKKDVGWEIAAAVLDMVAANVNRNVILDHIATKQAEGVAAEDMPAVIRDLRVQADADTQAKIDAKRAQS